MASDPDKYSHLHVEDWVWCRHVCVPNSAMPGTPTSAHRRYMRTRKPTHRLCHLGSVLLNHVMLTVISYRINTKLPQLPSRNCINTLYPSPSHLPFSTNHPSPLSSSNVFSCPIRYDFLVRPFHRLHFYYSPHMSRLHSLHFRLSRSLPHSSDNEGLAGLSGQG